MDGWMAGWMLKTRPNGKLGNQVGRFSRILDHTIYTRSILHETCGKSPSPLNEMTSDNHFSKVIFHFMVVARQHVGIVAYS